MRTGTATVVRLVIAVFFFANAIAPGVCAGLCASGLGCPFRAASKTTFQGAPVKLICTHCKPNTPGKQSISATNDSEDCCAWIAKKGEPPAASLDSVTFSTLTLVAALPSVPSVEVKPLIAVDVPRYRTEDRAPPWAPQSPCESRAPPTC